MIGLLGALGVAIYVFAPESGHTTEQKSKMEIEVRESKHTGFLRSANRSNEVVHSEETAIVRPARGRDSPLDTAAKWQVYHYTKNNILGTLGSWGGALNNLGIIRPDYRKKPGLPGLINHEGFHDWDAVPNAWFDRQSAATPPENMPHLNRDQFGNSGGTPQQGPSDVVLSKLYVGNPWGVGGQDFIAVGNQYRQPGYGNKPTSILKKKVSFNSKK